MSKLTAAKEALSNVIHRAPKDPDLVSLQQSRREHRNKALGYSAVGSAIALGGGIGVLNTLGTANQLHHSAMAFDEALLPQLAQIFADNGGNLITDSVSWTIGITAAGVIMSALGAHRHLRQARDDGFNIAQMQMNARQASAEY